MLLVSSTGKYQVGDKVAETAAYRIYICKAVEPDRQLLLQIATDVASNGGLERAAYLLGELKQTADLFEAEYAKEGSGRLLSYNRLFPAVVDSFIAEDQGKRRVNVLAFTEIEDVRQMVPLSNLGSKDRLRVALVSSAWIMGRLLKLLGFAHNEGIAVHLLGGNNVLIEPAKHFVVVFDWSTSQTFPEGVVPRNIRKDDIASAAKTVLAAIGADPETGNYPYNDAEDPRYVQFLWGLTRYRYSNAEEAHTQFYELVNELWGRKFLPFKTMPR